jgi:hypothetical protein
LSTPTGNAQAPCSRCGVAFEPRAWRTFELVEQIASDRVREFVTIWPDHAVIEVRRCACGQIIARKTRPEEVCALRFDG